MVTQSLTFELRYSRTKTIARHMMYLKDGIEEEMDKLQGARALALSGLLSLTSSLLSLS